MDVMRFAVAAVSLAGALLASTILVSADAMIPLPGDPVATTSGKVAGTKLSSGVKAYLGIPFAKPPTGELRWKPPQPISWDGVWNADRKGPECIQVLRAHDINHYFGEEPTSEDCLYLNLWAPAEAKPGDGRPVIVFIYGGGGTLGSSGMANYGGENMAQARRHLRQLQLSRRHARLHGASRADAGAGRPFRQLRLSRPERGAEMDARQHRDVRRRSRPRW